MFGFGWKRRRRRPNAQGTSRHPAEGHGLDAGKDDDVERELDRIVDVYSEFQEIPPEGMLAGMRSNLGAALAARGEHAQAEKLLLEAIELWPGCADAYRNLAALYSEMGKHREAEELLQMEKAIRRDAPRFVLRPEKRAEFRELFRDSVEGKKRRKSMG
jgi:tetratricopeptide (TPR) repeat protein